MSKTKYYFGQKRRSEGGLYRILAAILLLLLVIGIGIALWRGMSGDASQSEAAPAATASAPATSPLTGALADARTQLEAGDAARASELLAAFSPRNAHEKLDALLLRADIALRAGAPQELLSPLENAAKEHARDARYPEIALKLAQTLEHLGRTEEARLRFEEIRKTAPAPFRAAAVCGIARAVEAGGDLLAARTMYKEALAETAPGSPAWREAVDGLGRVNVALIFQPAETPESRYYSVQPGDSLTNIGIALNTTQGLLMRANGLYDAARLRPGQRLKYTPKDFRVIIERSTCQLFLLDADGIFKRYDCGLGMPGYETTLGKYTIGNKQKDPTWFKPGSAPVPPGDPQNELGTRWMPLVPAEPGLPTDLGIHGTIAPETIGQYKSHGCPRLRKEDVEELYDLIVRSTPVEIVEKIDWPQILSSGSVPSRAA